MKNKPTPAIVKSIWRSLGIPPYVTEHHFAAQITFIGKDGRERKRAWRFDYAWLSQKVALEVEGAIFMAGGGRHNRGGGMKADMLKYNTAVMLGWRVLRVMPEQLLKQPTIDMLLKVLNQ